jgi:hypothetical protein
VSLADTHRRSAIATIASPRLTPGHGRQEFRQESPRHGALLTLAPDDNRRAMRKSTGAAATGALFAVIELQPGQLAQPDVRCALSTPTLVSGNKSGRWVLLMVEAGLEFETRRR